MQIAAVINIYVLQRVNKTFLIVIYSFHYDIHLLFYFVKYA